MSFTVGLEKHLTQKKESTRTVTVCHQPDLKPALTSWPHLHTDLQQITGAVRSPPMLQMLHHHPRPKGTQNYWI